MKLTRPPLGNSDEVIRTDRNFAGIYKPNVTFQELEWHYFTVDRVTVAIMTASISCDVVCEEICRHT